MITAPQRLCLSTFSLLSSLALTPTVIAGTDTWSPTAAGTEYGWNDPANWASTTQFPNGIGDVANVNINIAGAQTILLNAPITVGTLNFGDSATAFFAQTITAGAAGSLTFDVTSGKAELARTIAVNPNLSDTISAGITLNDDLNIRMPFLGNGNGIILSGVIGGTGGITLTNPGLPAGTGNSAQIIDLRNAANSFTGAVEVGNSTLVFRGDAPVSADSGLGKSAASVKLGGVASLAGTGTPSLANNLTAELRLQASDDTTNYTFARDLDLSGSRGNGPSTGRVRFTVTGNNGGDVNTNTLTVTGNVILPGPEPGNARGVEFFAGRQGQTMRFTGDIRVGAGDAGTTGTIFWGPGAPGAPNADGRTSGTYRFSDLPRTYTNLQNLTNGTIILEGSVGATGTPSAAGTQTFDLADGNGGNMFSANQTGPNRRLFLEVPETSFARNLTTGGGTSSNLATAANIGGVLPGVFQPLYGNSGTANIFNGYEIGGLNTSGTITFSGNISGAGVFTPVTGTAGGLGGSNPVTITSNVALSAATGGTAVFSGNIAGSNPAPLGDTATAGATSNAGNNLRITINQFRNHPNLDANVDGIPDAHANQPVGIPAEGTVILTGFNTYGGGTEVMGGTLLLNGSTGTGAAGDILLVNAAAKLGGTGSLTGPVRLADGAGLRYTISTDSASHDPMEVFGPLTFEGRAALEIRADGNTAAPGLYALVSASDGITGTLPSLTLPAGWSGALAISGSSLQLNLTSTGGGAAGYSTWAAGSGLTGPAAAANADPDNDGLHNLAEYVLGTRPDTASTGPAVSPAPGGFTMTFKRSDLSETDTTLKLQIGPGLSTWPEEFIIGAASGAAAGVAWTITENGVADDNITITVPVTAATRRFARLRMTK